MKFKLHVDIKVNLQVKLKFHFNFKPKVRDPIELHGIAKVHVLVQGNVQLKLRFKVKAKLTARPVIYDKVNVNVKVQLRCAVLVSAMLRLSLRHMFKSI